MPPYAVVKGLVKFKLVAVIVPVEIPPVEILPEASLLTKVLAVLLDVAALTVVDIVAIVEDTTPPTLFTTALPVTFSVPLNDGLV